jgi:hypothetical protein
MNVVRIGRRPEEGFGVHEASFTEGIRRLIGQEIDFLNSTGEGRATSTRIILRAGASVRARAIGADLAIGTRVGSAVINISAGRASVRCSTGTGVAIEGVCAGRAVQTGRE